MRTGGSLVVDAPHLTELRSFDPIRATDIHTSSVAVAIYEGLLGYAPGSLNEFAPLLAESWETSDDGKTWTFRLRRGVRFHDDPCFPEGRGREVTLADVHYSLLRTLELGERTTPLSLRELVVGGEAFARGDTDEPAGIELLDDNRIRFRLRQASPAFAHALAGAAGWIIPREAVEQYGAGYGQHPVGTGPFRLASWSTFELILVKNGGYWRSDGDGVRLPYLDSVVMRRLSMAGNRRQALSDMMEGSLHMVYFTGELAWEEFDRLGELLEGRGARAIRTPKLNTIYYAWNLSHDNVWSRSRELRHAVSAAVQRPAANEMLVPAAGLMPPGMPGCGGPPPPVDQDPQRARDLLAAAGFPGGRGLPELEIHFLGSSMYVMNNFISPLNEIGIRTAVRSVPWDRHWEALGLGEFSFFRDGWIADYPDPENFFSLFYSRSPVNHTRYSNPTYDRLFEEFQVTPVNSPERVRICAELEALLRHDRPAVFLYHERSVYFVRNEAHNIELSINPFERKFYEYVWLDDRKQP